MYRNVYLYYFKGDSTLPLTMQRFVTLLLDDSTKVNIDENNQTIVFENVNNNIH